MKIRKISIFIVLISLLYIPIIINAETYQCEYKIDSTSDIWLMEFDNEAGTVKNLKEKEDTIAYVSYSYFYEYKFLKNEITTYKKNICPVLFMAVDVTTGTQQMIYDYKVYSDSYLRENGGSLCVTNRDVLCLKEFFGAFTYYYTAALTNSEINKNNKLESICPSYIILKKTLEDLYKNYNNCSNSGCSNYIEKANATINEIKLTCNSMLSYRDVFVEGAEKKIRDECIEICLNIEKHINGIKKAYNIAIETGGECGFTGRLISFFSNILRWIKYILPVVVIVLGILDFMKAMGADKEDEMKKAQQKFIRRIIAAALLFIVPLILEFILDKMGFGYDDCGLF